MTPFQFLQPEPYLKAWLHSKSRARRSQPLRDWIAVEMGWTRSRISRVLTGKARIRPAETARLSQIFQHDENESAFYLAMTHWNWAEKSESRVRFWDEMERIRTTRILPAGVNSSQKLNVDASA